MKTFQKLKRFTKEPVLAVSDLDKKISVTNFIQLVSPLVVN